MSFPGQPVTAMLINNQTGARQKVRTGESLDGWTVTEVTPRNVIVTLGQRTSEIGSAMGAGSSGITHVPRREVIESNAATRGVKILSGRGSQTSVVPTNPTNKTPRLYRPPAT